MIGRCLALWPGVEIQPVAEFGRDQPHLRAVFHDLRRDGDQQLGPRDGVVFILEQIAHDWHIAQERYLLARSRGAILHHAGQHNRSAIGHGHGCFYAALLDGGTVDPRRTRGLYVAHFLLDFQQHLTAVANARRDA